MSTLPLTSRYFPLEFAIFGGRDLQGIGDRQLLCWLNKANEVHLKSGKENSFELVCEKSASSCRGLEDASVLETDVLLLSSLSFDLQRQGGQACDFQILSCFHVEYVSVKKMFIKQLSCPRVSKGVLAPRPLDCGCSRSVSDVCLPSTGFSFSLSLIIQPPSRLCGRSIPLEFQAWELTHTPSPLGWPGFLARGMMNKY